MCHWMKNWKAALEYEHSYIQDGPETDLLSSTVSFQSLMGSHKTAQAISTCAKWILSASFIPQISILLGEEKLRFRETFLGQFSSDSRRLWPCFSLNMNKWMKWRNKKDERIWGQTDGQTCLLSLRNRLHLGSFWHLLRQCQEEKTLLKLSAALSSEPISSYWRPKSLKIPHQYISYICFMSKKPQ